MQNVLSLLQTGPAGARQPGGGISAVPNNPGYVFTGSLGSLESGCYRIDLIFDRSSFVSAVTDRSGLMLEVVHGAQFIGSRPMAINDLARGSQSIEFRISAAPATGNQTVELRLFSAGQTGFMISGASIERISSCDPNLDIAEFSYVSMLTAGRAGVRGPGPAGFGRVINAQKGIADFVAFGPYVWFPQGTYDASFVFRVEENESVVSLKSEVVSDLGEHVHAQESIELLWQQNRLMRLLKPRRELERVLRFDVDAGVPQRENALLEFRVWSPGKIAFSLNALRVRRVR